MSNLYQVQVTVWIEAESTVAAADEAFEVINALAGRNKPLVGVEVPDVGEFVGELE